MTNHCFSSSSLHANRSQSSRCTCASTSPSVFHLPSFSCPVLQVAVSTDSQEVLCSDGAGGSSEGLLNVAALGLPLSSSSSSTSPSSFSHHPHQQQQPALCLTPAAPGASGCARPSSVHTQHHDQHCLTSYSSSTSPLHPPLLPNPLQQQQREEEATEDQEVSLITCGGLADSDDIIVEDGSSGSNEGHRGAAGCQESQSSCLRQLKRFHSADTQDRSTLLPRPRPHSWLDDPHRHSVEVCSAKDRRPQHSTHSTSSGFVSQTDSLQMHSQVPNQSSLPSPRRKKKTSPPCISVDAPDELETQSGLYPVLGGLGVPPPLLSRDTCLRRRVPSSDSKDSFDLGVGEGSGQEGGLSNPNPKLLTLPSFSFEKTTSEH